MNLLNKTQEKELSPRDKKRLGKLYRICRKCDIPKPEKSKAI